jgi:hypothetical protein
MKKILRIALVAMLCAVTHAQVPVAPIVQPHVTFVNASGGPCAGCSIATFAAGTTTPSPTYTDSTGTSVNTNPIILDAAGGANIWVGRSSYKFILKTALGATIWSVDNVNEGNLMPCGPAGSVQIANVSVTGMDCDAAIFINKSNHTFNVGTIGAAHVVIGPLGAPTLWTFDTTTPATALASLGGGLINAGTINQLAFYAAAGNQISGTSAIPSGITATTQAPSDNSTKLATTAYVALPGAINPTSVNGVPLSSTGSSTLFLNQAGGYTAPAGSAPPTTTMAFPSNSFGTTYTNGASRLEVAVTGNCTCNVGHFSQITASVNGHQVAANGTTNGGGLASVTFVVPPSGTYSVTFAEVGTSGGTLTLSSWVEWTN